jgi:L-iditol 2-dehydrogenase
LCAVHRENLCENGFKAIGYQWDGGFAEYMIMPKVGVDQGCLIPVPEDMSAEEGTLLEPLSCCVNGMRCIPMEDAEHVVIFGGGIIGVLNGMVARARGAKTITIMDVSQDRLDLHQRLGLPFDHWVNSATTDPKTWVMEQTGGRGVDVVVVAASVKALVSRRNDAASSCRTPIDLCRYAEIRSHAAYRFESHPLSGNAYSWC